MKLYNPFATLTKFELALWLFSLAVIAVTFITAGAFDPLVLAVLLVGATALIFVSKGDPTGQLLTVLFAAIYGIISFRLRYYGEMITYMGMSAPIAAASFISWLRHPFARGKAEVAVGQLTSRTVLLLAALTAAVTFAFYFILAAFDTPTLPVATISVATSFAASALTLLRSPWYALAYSANDVVLIILWVIASFSDRTYIPMIVCVVIFLANDLYGFINWRKIAKKQKKTAGAGLRR